MQSLKKIALGSTDTSSLVRLTVIDNQLIAIKLLSDSVNRYYRKETNFFALKRVKGLLPNSLCAHLIEALNEIQQTCTPLLLRENSAYLCLAEARKLLSLASIREQELFREVDKILEIETEISPNEHYWY